MSRRALRWLVLGFATLWFGVLVPVHNRGQIAVAGSGCDSAPACHASRPPCHQQAPDPPARPTRACAVCYFIAGLDAPPPVTVVETLLGPAGTVDPPAPRAPVSVRPAAARLKASVAWLTGSAQRKSRPGGV